MKIGMAEFYEDEATELRNLLFLLIQEEAPHVIESIFENLYPIYVKAFPTHNIKYLQQAKQTRTPETELYLKLFNEWSADIGLDKDWAKNRVLFILSSWKNEYIKRNGKMIKQRGIIHMLPGSESITGVSKTKPSLPALDDWKPWFETDDYFRACIEDYISQVKAIYLKNGWKERITKRDRGTGPFSHLRWLIHYRFLKKPIADIAQEYINSDPSGTLDISSDAIKKGIKSIRKIIDL
jgi:hypothetical protein